MQSIYLKMCIDYSSTEKAVNWINTLRWDNRTFTLDISNMCHVYCILKSTCPVIKSKLVHTKITHYLVFFFVYMHLDFMVFWILDINQSVYYKPKNIITFAEMEFSQRFHLNIVHLFYFLFFFNYKVFGKRCVTMIKWK